MPDEARKFLEVHDDWMGKELVGALPISYVKYRVAEPAAEHIRRLLAENEGLRKALSPLAGAKPARYHDADSSYTPHVVTDAAVKRARDALDA